MLEPPKECHTIVVLPSSKVRVKIVLTQPKIRAKQCLFHDDNPFAPTPEGLHHVVDLNTDKRCCIAPGGFIADPTKQIVLPVVMNMDGSQTGVLVDFELTPVENALGMFNRVALKNAQFMGAPGCIPSIANDESRERKVFTDSVHADAVWKNHQWMHDGGMGANMQNAHPTQDPHTTIDVVMVLRAGMEEADKLCGACMCRSLKVAQLCPKC